jgi:hypothetical protein
MALALKKQQKFSLLPTPKGNYTNNPETEINLQLCPRITETVSMQIPTDTLESLTKIATIRNMSVEALLKFYIGQGLRADLTKDFSERLLDTTAQVLARHLDSEEEISTIMREIQAETARYSSRQVSQDKNEI